MKRFLLTFLIAAMLPFIALSAPVPPPATHVTYEQYQSLIREKAAEVPELQMLWNWARKDQINDVYLGGGILRGLLLWINKNLHEKGFEATRKLPTPNVNTLLIQKDADKDIFASDRWAKQIKAWQPYASWDVLNETFYRQSVANQGATFDRIRVSLNNIDDPLSALEDFYNGKLTFRTNGVPFKAKHDVSVFGDNWLNLTLRYLRFTQDLREVVDGDSIASEEIRKLAKERATWIPTNTEFHLAWPQVRNADLYMAFRIRKALNKMHKATKGDTVQFLRVLDSHGLLTLLSSRHYNVADFSHSDFDLVVEKVLKSELGMRAAWQFARMQCTQVPRCIEMHSKMFTKAKNAADRLLALRPLRGTMSDAYRTALAEYWVRVFKANPKLDLGLDAKAAHEFERTFNRTDFSLAIKTHILSTTDAVEEMIKVLESAFPNATAEHKAKISALAKANLEGIASRIQSANDLRRFEMILNNYDSALQAKRIALKKAPAAEVPGMLTPAWTGGNSANYQAQVAKLKTEVAKSLTSFQEARAKGFPLETILALNPSLVNGSDLLAENESRLSRAKSAQEALAALQPLESNAEYKAQLAELVVRSFSKNPLLVKHQPELNEMRALELTFANENLSEFIKRRAFSSASDLKTMLGVLEPVASQLKSVSEKLASEYSGKLVEKSQNVADLFKVEAMLSGKTAIAAKETYIAKTLSNAEALEAMAASESHKNNSEYLLERDRMLVRVSLPFFSKRTDATEARAFFAHIGDIANAWPEILANAKTQAQLNSVLVGLSAIALELSENTRSQVLEATREVLVKRGYSLQYYNELRSRFGFQMISRTEAGWPSVEETARKRQQYNVPGPTLRRCVDLFN